VAKLSETESNIKAIQKKDYLKGALRFFLKHPWWSFIIILLILMASFGSWKAAVTIFGLLLIWVKLRKAFRKHQVIYAGVITIIFLILMASLIKTDHTQTENKSYESKATAKIQPLVDKLNAGAVDRLHDHILALGDKSKLIILRENGTIWEAEYPYTVNGLVYKEVWEDFDYRWKVGLVKMIWAEVRNLSGDEFNSVVKIIDKRSGKVLTKMTCFGLKE
jgi:hypothetical protein